MWLLLAAALQVITAPQPWIGTVEYTDFDGLHVGRVSADLRYDGTTLTIDAHVRHGGRLRMTSTVRTNQSLANGTLTMLTGATDLEGNFSFADSAYKCHGETRLSGRWISPDVLRLTASRVKAKGCDSIRNVVILLQPHPRVD